MISKQQKWLMIFYTKRDITIKVLKFEYQRIHYKMIFSWKLKRFYNIYLSFKYHFQKFRLQQVINKKFKLIKNFDCFNTNPFKSKKKSIL